MCTIEISIVIPCFNSRNFISEAVVSACTQSYTNYEVLVIDNNSTDGTYELLEELKKIYKFRLFRNKTNIGAIENFNKGISKANGKYIKFLESDDILEANCLSIMKGFLTENVSFVCGSKIIINENSSVTGYHDVETTQNKGLDILKSYRKTGNIIGTPSDCLIEKELLLKVGGFSKRYGSYLNDLDVWLKICNENCIVQWTSERICRVRRHGAQMGASGTQSLADLNVAFKMLDETYFHDQRFLMEVHIGSAYLYRAIRQATKLRHGNFLRTLQILYSHMQHRVIYILPYLPIYFYLLINSKCKR